MFLCFSMRNSWLSASCLFIYIMKVNLGEKVIKVSATIFMQEEQPIKTEGCVILGSGNFYQTS